MMVKEHKNLKSVELCDLLVDASIDRVMAIDAEWRIIAWNKTSELVTGLKKADIMGRPLLDVFPELAADAPSVEGLQQALEGKKYFLPPDPRFAHRSFYETHFIPLKDDDGMLIGVMNLMHDVSHRMKAEMELQRLNATLTHQYGRLEKTNAELALFTSITSKDLQQPLRKLYTGLEMLVKADGSKLSDSSKGGLRRMQASLTKMNLMLDDVLALSSTMSFDEKFVPLELDEILASALEMLQAKITDKNALVEAETLPTYYGSFEMLRYLFFNLIDNALKFQETGSTPWIKISAELISPLNKVAGDNGNAVSFLCVSFTDNGIGFPIDAGKRMFNMFERLHSPKDYPGSGIGLTISRKIAEAHGGYIEATLSAKGGSIFKCFLAQR